MLPAAMVLSTNSDLDELFDQLRRRPGMFFGQAGTLPLLGALRSGLRTPPFRPEEPRFADFTFWLSARIDDRPDSHTMVDDWLAEQHVRSSTSTTGASR